MKFSILVSCLSVRSYISHPCLGHFRVQNNYHQWSARMKMVVEV